MDIEKQGNQTNEPAPQQEADNGQQQRAEGDNGQQNDQVQAKVEEAGQTVTGQHQQQQSGKEDDNRIKEEKIEEDNAEQVKQVQPQAQPVKAPAQPEVKNTIPENFPQIFDEFRIQIKNGLSQKVRDLLNKHSQLDLANKLDPQTRQISLFTAAVLPDEETSLEMFKVLLEGGANPNFVDPLKQNVVYYLAREGKSRVLEMLFRDYNVQPDPRDSNGQSPMFYAAVTNMVQAMQTLVKYGADPKAQDTLCQQTALFYAAREGNTESCKFLLENGCQASHQDMQKKQALFFAKKNNKKETVELLNQYMIKEKEQLKAKQQKAASIEEQDKRLLKRKKPDKAETAKMSYKLIYTNEKGESKELTQEEFEQFKQKHPDIANFLLNADTKIDDDMINKIRNKESWDKVAKRILSTTSKSRNAFLFLQPVDVKKFNIPDYYDIVKKPMDFGTIKQKLNSNVYSNMQEFIDDMDLVFYNCQLYNGAESDVGVMGNSVREDFLTALKQAGLNLKGNEGYGNAQLIEQNQDESSATHEAGGNNTNDQNNGAGNDGSKEQQQNWQQRDGDQNQENADQNKDDDQIKEEEAAPAGDQEQQQQQQQSSPQQNASAQEDADGAKKKTDEDDAQAAMVDEAQERPQNVKDEEKIDEEVQQPQQAEQQAEQAAEEQAPAQRDAAGEAPAQAAGEEQQAKQEASDAQQDEAGKESDKQEESRAAPAAVDEQKQEQAAGGDDAAPKE